MAALGGLIAAAPLVGAQSSTPDNSPHLLLVPDTPRADAALDASSARTVASYDAFTLVEARGEDDADLRAAGADRRDDMRRVSLPGGSFDPLKRESLATRGAPDPDEALAVVQFAGPVKDAWLERLGDSGARIVQYLPQNGYLVHASGAEVDRLAALVGTDTAVRAVTRVSAADKLSEEVARRGRRAEGRHSDPHRQRWCGRAPRCGRGRPEYARHLDGRRARDAVPDPERIRARGAGDRPRGDLDLGLLATSPARRAQCSDRGRKPARRNADGRGRVPELA